MPISYVVVQKGNPGNPNAPKKFYSQAKSSGEINLKKISREISAASTTVSDTDVLAVLNDLTKYIRRHLEEGEIVRLGDLGTFQITVTSAGAETETKAIAATKKPKVTFRSGEDLRESLAGLKYTKVKGSGDKGTEGNSPSTPSTPPSLGE